MYRSRLDLTVFDAILLDLGNVIIYDFPIELAYSYYVHQEIRRRRLSLAPKVDEILRASRTPSNFAVRLGSIKLWEEINTLAWDRVLDNWASLCILIPGAIETLHRLRDLRLAIVANQPKETMAVLVQLGIAGLFEEIILDSLVGFSKPELAIYKYAADSLNARPESLLMIGDRLDNDIFPAKALGMTTGWIRKFPIDQTLPIPLISQQWKQHYFRLKSTVANRDCAPWPDGSKEAAPDYVLECLADLFD